MRMDTKGDNMRIEDFCSEEDINCMNCIYVDGYVAGITQQGCARLTALMPKPFGNEFFAIPSEDFCCTLYEAVDIKY